jgi:hypothetical protein
MGWFENGSPGMMSASLGGGVAIASTEVTWLWQKWRVNALGRISAISAMRRWLESGRVADHDDSDDQYQNMKTIHI